MPSLYDNFPAEQFIVHLQLATKVFNVVIQFRV